MVHELKYRRIKSAGNYFGNMMGKSLLNSNRFKIDVFIPLPLFERKDARTTMNPKLFAVNCENHQQTYSK